MKLFKIFALPALLLFFSCKKTTNTNTTVKPTPVNTDLADGFTHDPGTINGYFYAGYMYSGSYTYLTSYSVLRDPAGDIMSNFNHYNQNQSFISSDNLGNIQVGQVTFNGTGLTRSNNNSFITYQYNSSNIQNVSNTATWHTDGNGSFKGFDVSIPKGFPKINITGYVPTYTYSAYSSWTLDFTTLITNFDSLIVTIGYTSSQGSGSSGVKKFTKKSGTSITLTQTELANLSSSSSYLPISFMAFNYSTKTVNGKVYVFELSNRFSTDLERSY